MSQDFEKFNRLNLLVTPEDIFDYMGAKVAKDDGIKVTYSCPYHDDDLPSLLVDKQTGAFNCFACDCGGVGGYSCAKYYLKNQNGKTPTMIMVFNFLLGLNPKVEHLRFMFTAQQHREYTRGENKREQFKRRARDTAKASMRVQTRKFNAEELALYIDGIMTGMPEDFIQQSIRMISDKNTKKVSDEFLSLLGD